MSDKKVDGITAAGFMDAAASMARLENLISDLRWRALIRDDLPWHVDGAKAECRRLLLILSSIENRKHFVDDQKVIKIEDAKKS